jgi:hypothetical protein
MTFDTSLGPLITVIRSAVTRGVTQVVANQSPPLSGFGAHAGLFIGEVKGFITMPKIPLTTYSVNRVHGQGVTWSITSSHYFTTV